MLVEAAPALEEAADPPRVGHTELSTIMDVAFGSKCCQVTALAARGGPMPPAPLDAPFAALWAAALFEDGSHAAMLQKVAVAHPREATLAAKPTPANHAGGARTKS